MYTIVLVEKLRNEGGRRSEERCVQRERERERGGGEILFCFIIINMAEYIM